VPLAQIAHVGAPPLRSTLPLAVAAPKPARHVSQSVLAMAANVIVVDVPAGHWLHDDVSEITSLYLGGGGRVEGERGCLGSGERAGAGDGARRRGRWGRRCEQRRH
jgi:hypothetical protein